MSSQVPPDPTGPGALESLAFAGDGARACAVKLDVFEGPLDLLLHLIRLSEVDVHDIPIAAIAEQYVEYLSLMRELDLDVAGEYLLMAATLAWIKSRMLLPPSEESEEEEGDPRLELVARLLEYQRFREAAEDLGRRPLLGREVFAAPGEEPAQTPDAERELDVDLFALVEAFRQVLRRARPPATPHEVESETVTVHECMLAVMARVEGASVVAFDDLFEDASGAAPSRTRLVATFLAILELARIAAVRLYQSLGEAGVPTGPIQVRLAPNGSGAWGERVADVT
ncbi:MAG TPA: segregation/condensation protein A [Myxococcota bacterium]|nr:segregation/condensation protein A [Myxococcota bacterium]